MTENVHDTKFSKLRFVAVGFFFVGGGEDAE